MIVKFISELILQTNTFSEFIENEIKTNFTPEIISHGRKVLNNHTIEESFGRAQHHKQFLSTGLLMYGTSLHNVKIQKKQDSETLDYRCSCTLGKKGQMCEHVCAYFINFLRKNEKKFIEALHSQDEEVNDHTAVAKKFGEIVYQGSELVKSAYKHFTQLDYKLIDGRIISFPKEVKPWGDKKLVFHIDKLIPRKDKQILEVNEVKCFLEDSREVSIFENKYIFNWNTGELTELPIQLKKVFLYIKHSGKKVNVNFLASLIQSEFTDVAQLRVENHFISEYTNIPIAPFIKSIENDSHLIEVSLSFQTEDKKFFIPELTRLFANQNGLFTQFTSRSELKRFVAKFMLKDESFKEYTYTLENKEIYLFILESLTDGEDILDIDHKNKIYYSWNFPTFFKIIQLMYNRIGDSLFLGMKFDPINSELNLKIPKVSYQDQLFQLFSDLKDFDIPIYFQEKRIKNWNSKIKFNRHQTNSDWFDLDLSLTKEELEFIKNIEFDKKLNTLGDDLILLNDEQLKYIKLIKKYITHNPNKVKEGERISFQLRFNRCQLFDIYQIYKYSGENLLSEEEQEVCQKLLNLKKIPEYPFPGHEVYSPRDYQQTGFRWLKLLYELKLGACLADDMGLGKTYQTISFLKSINSEIKKVLIVCPVSIIANWQSEFEKFSDLRIDMYYGDSRVINEDSKYIITSYGILRKDFDTRLKDIQWDVFIMDEVQKLKNVKSLGAQTARNVNAKYRICLTGTPVENDISEYYNILDLAVPGIWGSQLHMNYYKKNKDSRFLAREITKPFVLRRTKKQVLHDLPEKTEQVISLEFSSEERKNYIASLAQIRKEIKELDKGQKYIKVLSNILKLRQLCLWQNMSESFRSTKINFLINTLDQVLLGETQVLIYSQFTKYLDIIQKHIVERQWKFSRIDGSFSLKKRVKEIDKFKAGDTKVFLISLKAGGLGLNLTEASYVFLMDPWWNPAIESQAIDRAHRIGQKKNLTVYKPIIKDSVEEKVLELQEKKRELFDDLLGDDLEKVGGKLSFDDFESILSL